MLTVPGISVVVPVFNSSASLEELVSRIHRVLVDFGQDFEVVLVNDGSSDKSWLVINELVKRYQCVRAINLLRNYGQHNALMAGIRSVRFDVVVTLDDDLQNPPEEIPLLIQELEEGNDVVYGVPEHLQHGLLRDLASKITKLAIKSAMGVDVAPKVSAFRAFRSELRCGFASYQSSFVSIDVLLTWGAVRYSSVVVRHEPRRMGRSNYTFRMLLVHAVNMITGYSTIPLQIASLIGFIFTVFGICVFGYVVCSYVIRGGSLPGFPFLASIISIFSGAQLFALGVIGEYLARMHFRSMDRPAYVIREETN